MTSLLPKLFKDDPPKKGFGKSGFDTLDDIVSDWTYRFGKKGKNKMLRDTCVEHCISSKSLEEAIDRACDSLRTNGKLHNHQSRVRKKDRDYFAKLIKNEFDSSREYIKDFDALYDMLERIKPKGIGPVTHYDVASRIAAYMKLPINSLYLHAGVRLGWHRLYDRRSPRLLRVPKSELPKALQKIPCDEVEDMLCAYREYLKPWEAKHV